MTPRTWRSSAFAFRLGAIALVAFAVRVAYVLAIARHLRVGYDAVWYTFAAGPLAHGRGFVDPAEYFETGQAVATAVHPPLYPAFLAAVTRVLNGHDETFQLVGATAGTVTVILTGYVGRRVAGPRVGLVAAALTAVYPALIAVDGSLMSETITVPVVVGMVGLALVAVARPSWWRFALLGLLAGVLTLARADGLAIGVLVILSAAFAISRRRRVRVSRGLVALGALGCVVVPWMVRNDVRVGTATIATLSTAHTISGANCSSTYSGALLGYWDPRCADDGPRGPLSEATWAHRQTRQGLDYGRSHLGRVPVVVATRELRVLGLFHPLAQARLDAIETRSYRWQLFAWACWLPVMVFGVLGLVRIARNNGRTALPLFAVLAAVAVTVGLSYGNQRFRAACEPVLLIGTASSVIHHRRQLRHTLRRSARAGGSAAGNHQSEAG